MEGDFKPLLAWGNNQVLTNFIFQCAMFNKVQVDQKKSALFFLEIANYNLLCAIDEEKCWTVLERRKTCIKSYTIEFGVNKIETFPEAGKIIN